MIRVHAARARSTRSATASDAVPEPAACRVTGLRHILFLAGLSRGTAAFAVVRHEEPE